MIRVLLVDDQLLLRESLEYILSSDSEIEVIGSVGTGKEGVLLAEKYKPDVVLMDIRMPDLNGIEATKIIKENHPDIKVIILTTFEEEESIVNSFIAGADGFLIKDFKPAALQQTIKFVNEGFHLLHSSAYQMVREQFDKAQKLLLRDDQTDIKEKLTEGDLEIIRLMVDGKSNREISENLNYSEGTIRNRISRILADLELRDRTQIAVFALRNNLI